MFRCLIYFTPMVFLLFLFPAVPLVSQDGEGNVERWNRLQNYSDFSAYRTIGALMEAYPGIVTDRTRRKGDWSFLVRGRRFFWAGGRLLPEEDLGRAEDYSPQPFYVYPGDYEPYRMLYLGEREEELRRLVDLRENRPLNRHPGFYDALYRLHDEESAWSMMKSIFFLGHKVTLHRDLLEDLARVEETLIRELPRDEELKNYVDGLSLVAGYSWRPIAGTESRSNHSYGIALDFIPADYGDRDVYWRWSKDFNDQWYNIPWNRMHRPPESFVRAFEAEGFVWGGKWLLFDTIHFEYRPELEILNR